MPDPLQDCKAGCGSPQIAPVPPLAHGTMTQHYPGLPFPLDFLPYCSPLDYDCIEIS